MITRDTIDNDDLLGLRIKAARVRDKRTVDAVDRYLQEGDEAALAIVLAKLNEKK